MSGSAVSNVVPNTSLLYNETLKCCGRSIKSVLDANPDGLCSAIDWKHMVSEVKDEQDTVILSIQGKYHNCDAYYHWMLKQEESGFRGILDMKKFKYSQEDGTCEDSPVQYPMKDPIRESTLPKLIEDVVHHVLFYESKLLHEQVKFNLSYASRVKLPTKFAPNVMPEQKPITPRDGDQLHELKSALAKSQRERDDVRDAYKTLKADFKMTSNTLEFLGTEKDRLSKNLDDSEAISRKLRKELDASEAMNKRLRGELEASEEKNKTLEAHTAGSSMLLAQSAGYINRIKELEAVIHKQNTMIQEQNTMIQEHNAMIRRMRGTP
jgi:hypothetical protein